MGSSHAWRCVLCGRAHLSRAVCQRRHLSLNSIPELTLSRPRPKGGLAATFCTLQGAGACIGIVSLMMM